MVKSKEIYQVCEGCANYGTIEMVNDIENYHRGCEIEYPVLSIHDQCPCITCLVKGICAISCKAYMDYKHRSQLKFIENANHYMKIACKKAKVKP